MYIKTDKRDELLKYLNKKEIKATFHYIPLHSSIAGQKYGKFVGIDKYTTKESNNLIRLPLFYKIEEKKIKEIIKHIKEFYENSF